MQYVGKLFFLYYDIVAYILFKIGPIQNSNSVNLLNLLL